MKYNTVETVMGKGGWDPNQVPAFRSESVVCYCKVKDSCEDQSSGQGAESHEIMQKTI